MKIVETEIEQNRIKLNVHTERAIDKNKSERALFFWNYDDKVR